MSIFSKLGALIFAPTDAAGNPRQVINHDAQVWSTEVERIIQVALEGGDLLVYGSLSALNADLDHAAHTGAILIGESIADDGLYMKQGASGSGSWVKIGNVPGQGFVKATNAGAGTANAIAATTPVAVNETQLILLPITAANTASPVTVAFNGGAALTVKTVSGNDVAAGGLPAGSVMLGVVQGGDFRLLSDQASAGIQAAAEAAQVAAEAALAEMREKSVGAFPDNASADAFLTAEGLTKQKGTIYFNTTADVWRYWDGSAWQTFPYATVADGGVTTVKLDDEAVTEAKLADEAVTEAKITNSRSGQVDILAKLLNDDKIGLVAGPGRSYNSLSAGYQQMMSRTKHFAYEDIDAFSLIFGNWHASPVEADGGATLTLTASVEYPVGVFTQVRFSGSASGTISPGSNRASDTVSLEIPEGAEFWVRTYATCSAGVVHTYNVSGNDQSANSNAHQSRFGASGVSDVTMGGTITSMSQSTGLAYGPMAIVGATTKPSVVIYGDSIALGHGDQADGDVHIGSIARSLGETYPCLIVARGGEKLDEFLSGNAKRRALAQYCTHVVCAYGNNDIFSGGASAQALSDGLDEFAGLFPDRVVYTITITPRSTSTDNWATEGNQTPAAADNVKDKYNTFVRNSRPGVEGYFEIADVAEPVRGGGIWKVTGAANGYTADGIHPTQAGYLLIKNSGNVKIDLTESVYQRPRPIATKADMLAGFAADRVATPLGVAQATGLGEFGAGMVSFGPGYRVLGPPSPTTDRPSKVIASGEISVGDRSYCLLETEGLAAEDDLDTINGGKEGDILILRTAAAARDVRVKHGTGNILLNGWVDFLLDTGFKHVGLMKIATGHWIEIFRHDYTA